MAYVRLTNSKMRAKPRILAQDSWLGPTSHTSSSFYSYIGYVPCGLHRDICDPVEENMSVSLCPSQPQYWICHTFLGTIKGKTEREREGELFPSAFIDSSLSFHWSPKRPNIKPSHLWSNKKVNMRGWHLIEWLGAGRHTDPRRRSGPKDAVVLSCF